MTAINFDVKAEAMRNGVKLYQIAQKLGMSESAFNHRMRGELTQADRERFFKAIKEISRQDK